MIYVSVHRLYIARFSYVLSRRVAEGERGQSLKDDEVEPGSDGGG